MVCLVDGCCTAAHLMHNNSVGCECLVDPNCGPQPVALGPYLTQVCCNGQWRVMRARGALPPCVSLTRVRVTVFAFKNVYLCVTRPGLRLDYDVTIYDNATCQWIDDYEQGASAMCRSVRKYPHRVQIRPRHSRSSSLAHRCPLGNALCLRRCFKCKGWPTSQAVAW